MSGSSCDVCGARPSPEAFFCSTCGDLVRRPPAGAIVAPIWRAVLAARDDEAARDTVFGAPAVMLPDDPDDGGTEPVSDTAPSPPAARPEQPSAVFEHISLDPPEGFRETAWFLDGEDPEMLSAIEHDDVEHTEREGRYRAGEAVVDEDARRRLSLAEDDRGEP